MKRALAAAIAVCAMSCCASLTADDDLRLRIAWGGESSRQWQGTIRVTDGSFAEFVGLGREADDPGSIEVDGQVLRIAQRRPSTYNGLDVLVQGAPDAKLIVELAPRDRLSTVRRLEVPLAALVSKSHTAELDDQSSQLFIERAPGDRLRVEFERDTLVFRPGETFEFRVAPHRLGLDADTSLRCKVQLYKARSEEPLWSTEKEVRVVEGGNVPAIGPLSVALPASEGVYDIVISLAKRRLTDPLVLTQAKPFERRKIQLVVIDAQPPPPDRTAWKPIAEIDTTQITPTNDAASPRWSDWLKKIPTLKIPGFSKGPLGNGKATKREHLGQTWMQLAPGGWEAYPLPIARVDEPHVLEVEFPSDVGQTLGISIVEPNAGGQVVPLGGLDSGVEVSAGTSADAPHVIRHRLVFWPRTKTPLVLLVNRRDGGPAVFGKIAVQAGPTRLPPFAFGPEPPGERLLGIYLDKPLFPENFCAGEALDSVAQGTFDDWSTFYLGARRLVEHLKYAGYNGAVISVACDGSAIYPSRLLEPTPKYDTGVFFTSGQDPIRKDVLEMLFRVFDREGLKLVPALQFACPLPELERLRRRGGEDSAGLEWIGAQGQAWLSAFPTNQGLAPYYNPLQPPVQQAMQRVVAEVAQRYGEHRAFAGLAVQLGPDTYAQLPDEHWGFDDSTIARFEREAVQKVPGDGRDRFGRRAEFLSDDRRKSWLDWRAATLTDFYRHLREQVAVHNADATLFLATADLLVSRPLQQALRPSLPRQSNVTDALLQHGLDVKELQDLSHVVLFRPQRFAPLATLAGQATGIEANRAPELDRQFNAANYVGTQMYHETVPLRLPSFDAVSPFGAENTSTYLAAYVTPADMHGRRRFVHSLATLDAQALIDGGLMTPLGNEEALRPFVEVFRQLPADRFQTVTATSGKAQPLVVRALARGGKTFVYVVNDSPWPVAAEVDLVSLTPFQATALGGRMVPVMTRTGDVSRWSVKLQPFDVRAVTLSAAKVKVSDWRVTLEGSVLTDLSQQVQDIRTRANALRVPHVLDALKNPGFESPASKGLPGWIHAKGNGLQVHLDPTEAHGGKAALQVQSQQGIVWVRSEPIPPPPSGRLQLGVWIKVRDPKRQPELRVCLDDGQGYYPRQTLGTGGAQKLSDQWTEYRLLIDNIPQQGLGELRVGFDLMGAGEVWIDDVQLFDAWMSDKEQAELLKTIDTADFNLERGAIADCQRFLESYWPRFLHEHVPLPARVADRPQQPRTSREPSTAAKPDAPTWKDKVNGMLPKKMRPF